MTACESSFLFGQHALILPEHLYSRVIGKVKGIEAYVVDIIEARNISVSAYEYFNGVYVPIRNLELEWGGFNGGCETIVPSDRLLKCEDV